MSAAVSDTVAPILPRLTVVIAVLLVACSKAASAPGSAVKLLEDGCPDDLLAAQGAACREEGKTCPTGRQDLRRLVMCSGGHWAELNVPPLPHSETPPPPSAVAPQTPERPRDRSCASDDECIPVEGAGCCPSPCPRTVVNRRDAERAQAELTAACEKQESQRCPVAGGCRTHAALCHEGSCRMIFEGEPGYRERGKR